MDARYWGTRRSHLTLASLPENLPLLLRPVASGDPTVLTLLVEQSDETRTQLLAARGAGGRTALNIAAELGHAEAVQVLAEHGADVNAADDAGDAPLHAAAGGNQPAVIEQLLRLGADIDQPNLSRDNRTPLWVACKAGNADAARVLVQRGAAVNARGWGGYTCVHAAATRGSRAVLDVLLQPGTNADVNAEDADGYTVLELAVDAEPGNVDVVDRLLAAGAQTSDPQDANSSPALDYAARYLSNAVIDCFMKHRADQLAVPMLARAAAAATDAYIESEDVRTQQLGTAVKLEAATMAAAPDTDTAAAALLDALGVQNFGIGTPMYCMATAMRASLHGWAQAAARADDLESQRVAVQQWMVVVAQDHLRLIAVQEQLRQREEQVSLREQLIAERQQQVAEIPAKGARPEKQARHE